MFKNLKTAVSVTKKLREMVEETDWTSFNLPDSLTARFALDSGPCYSYIDPVTGRIDFCGAHVIRAARMEPVTPPGHIYASESFSALCKVENIDAELEVAGSVKLPKGYGEVRVYHLS